MLVGVFYELHTKKEGISILALSFRFSKQLKKVVKLITTYRSINLEFK